MIEIMKTQPNLTYIFLKKQEGRRNKRLIENGEKVIFKSQTVGGIKANRCNGWLEYDVEERLFIEEKKIKKALIEIVAKYTGIPCEKLKNRARDYLEDLYNEIKRKKTVMKKR